MGGLFRGENAYDTKQWDLPMNWPGHGREAAGYSIICDFSYWLMSWL